MSRFLTFERYYAPEAQAELFGLLQQEGPNARVLAGGTDLLIAMKEKGLRTACLVDLKRVEGLRGIQSHNGSGLSIGAATTLHEVETSQAVREVCPVLAEAVGEIASYQVRSRATLGGNLANASPAADSSPAILVLDGEFELASAAGVRVIPADAFFVGPGKSALAPGEILRRIRIPRPQPGAHAVYLKFGSRAAMDIAIVGVAVSLIFDGPTSCREARVALASVGPIPLRARKTEAALVGELTEPRIQEAAVLAAEEARPIDDVRGSAVYRRHLVRALTGQAVRKLMAQHRATVEKE